MVRDTYSAVWVSHTSMSDFLQCPRSYFLRNVYKDPRTGHKVSIVAPATSLGIAVHETLESLKLISVQERFAGDLLHDLERAWQKVSGKIGGFRTAEEERSMFERGVAMIERVRKNPGPLARKTVRLPVTPNGMPPNFLLSEDDNIILCGLVDWLEYREDDDSVKIVDFKTGRSAEREDSLQLPIYLLLVSALQRRTVSGAAYWYLEYADDPVEKALPPLDDARARVLAVARAVKRARELREFQCGAGAEGCYACRPYEMILSGEATHVGVGGYGQDLYMIE